MTPIQIYVLYLSIVWAAGVILLEWAAGVNF